MKKRLSIRTVIILTYLAFTLLVAGLAALASRYVRIQSYRVEQSSLLKDLEVIATHISANIKAGSSDPFDFIDIAYNMQEDGKWDYFYLLQEPDYTVVAPNELKDSVIIFEDKQTYAVKNDQYVLTAMMSGRECFVVPYQFPDQNLQLLGVYSTDYIFGERKFAVNSFLLVLSALLAILLLVCWLWVVPALQQIILKKEQAEGQLEVARNLQLKAVTQEFPLDSRADVYGVLRPMREVGGDIYLCQQVGDKLYFVIGDVSGKGAGASFVMFLVSSYLNSRLTKNPSLNELMSDCNNLLFDNISYDMFCTLFIGCIDLETLEMTYCNAGHMKPIIDGMFLDGDSQMVCGGFQDYPYTCETVCLHQGSKIILYTDGVTETRDKIGSFYGTARLLSWVQDRPSYESSKLVCESLLSSVSAFRGPAEQFDDIAILCIKL